MLTIDKMGYIMARNELSPAQSREVKENTE